MTEVFGLLCPELGWLSSSGWPCNTPSPTLIWCSGALVIDDSWLFVIVAFALFPADTCAWASTIARVFFFLRRGAIGDFELRGDLACLSSLPSFCLLWSVLSLASYSFFFFVSSTLLIILSSCLFLACLLAFFYCHDFKVSSSEEPLEESSETKRSSWLRWSPATSAARMASAPASPPSSRSSFLFFFCSFSSNLFYMPFMKHSKSIISFSLWGIFIIELKWSCSLSSWPERPITIFWSEDSSPFMPILATLVFVAADRSAFRS